MNRWHTILWLALLACGGERPEGTATSARPAAASASAPVASGSAGEPSGTSAAPVVDTNAALTGAWSGTYRSEKANPTLAPTVKVKAWASDDGVHGSGEGELRLEIAPDGSVKGNLEGPLGPADVVGAVEGERVHALLRPRSDDVAAFAGSLEAELEAGALVVRLRASDGAAAVVRSGQARLSR